MQTSISVVPDPAKSKSPMKPAAEFAREAEQLGVDIAWSAEAWGTDAVVPLAYVAAKTSKIKLATGIAQVTARTVAMTAMTAMTLDDASDGRFILGLGLSGPQVVEGLHGLPYARPLERLRETIDLLRLAFAGEKLVYEGNQLTLPRPGGEGKALRLSLKPHPEIPIHLATLGPRALELTGALADGWVATCFVPEKADYYLDHLRRGAVEAGRTLDAVAIDAGGPVAFGDDLERLVLGRKKALAFQLSAMGSPATNFYNNAYSRIGYAETADQVRKLWLDGRRDEAVTAVPDELALGTSLYGDDAAVRERIRAYRDAGVTSLRLEPMGRSPEEKLETLARAVGLAKEVAAE
jgi:F420-dependent oxidoreductase-like protein